MSLENEAGINEIGYDNQLYSIAEKRKLSPKKLHFIKLSDTYIY